MRNPYEREGHEHRAAERAGEAVIKGRVEEAFAQAEVPDDILKRIISKLHEGNINDLTEEEREIIKKVSEENNGVHH